MAKFSMWNPRRGYGDKDFDEVPQDNISGNGRLFIRGNSGAYTMAVEMYFTDKGPCVRLWGTLVHHELGNDSSNYAGVFNIDEMVQLKKLGED